MKIKMSRIKGLKSVAVACDEFLLSYTKGYGVLKLKDRTIIDCSLVNLLGYTNYKKKDELKIMLSKFMGE